MYAGYQRTICDAEYNVRWSILSAIYAVADSICEFVLMYIYEKAALQKGIYGNNAMQPIEHIDNAGMTSHYGKLKTFCLGSECDTRWLRPQIQILRLWL